MNNRPNHKADEPELPSPPDPFQEFSYESYKALLEDRIILLNGVVKEDIIEKAVVPILKLSQKNKKPIQIWLNSFGGSMEDGQAVVDVIRAVQIPIITFAFGKAMSAAFDIFLAGDHRILLSNTVLMCHSGSANLGGVTTASINVEADLHKVYFKRWAQFYASRTKISVQEWENLLNSGLNRYFFPEEAVAKGLAHKVLIPTPKQVKNINKFKW